MEERNTRAAEYSRRVRRTNRRKECHRSAVFGAFVKNAAVFIAGVLVCTLLCG